MFSREAYIGECWNRVQDFIQPRKSIVEYIRGGKRRPIGVMVAYRGTDNNVYVGYSLCNTKVDKFDKWIGLRKAVERAQTDSGFTEQWLDKVPHSVLKPLIEFTKRAERYFKPEE